MHTPNSAEESNCEFCETSIAKMHCDTCLVKLCTKCVGEHMYSDSSKTHKIVNIEDKKSTIIYPGCENHLQRICEFFCEECKTPLCDKCLIIDKHKDHKHQTMENVFHSKKKVVEEDRKEIKEVIMPSIQDYEQYVQIRMSQLEEEYGYLLTAITEQENIMLQRMNDVVDALKNEVSNMKTDHQEKLKNHADEVKKYISSIQDILHSSETFIDSNNAMVLLKYESQNMEKWHFPLKFKEHFPAFKPKIISYTDLQNLFGTFGTLTECSLLSEETFFDLLAKQNRNNILPRPSVKPFLRDPQIDSSIYTDYDYLYNVVCWGDNIWTSGRREILLKLFSINQNSLKKTIESKSKNMIEDIAVTNEGDLLYTDQIERTVNIVKNEEIKEVIPVQDWKPRGLCGTSCDDILVILDSDEYEQTKVVRFSCSIKKQTIQFDEESKPLYQYDTMKKIKHITENRNQDVCVVDSVVNTVVVVNQLGKLKNVYTGHNPAPNNKPFRPKGITTDTQCHILVTDNSNQCVHVIDKNGQFLRYIDCGLKDPRGICTDANDSLYVAQFENGEVKKINYLDKIQK